MHSMRAEIGSQLSCSREVDYGHRVSPMLAGTVIKKSCISIGPILEGRAYYALRYSEGIDLHSLNHAH